MEQDNNRNFMLAIVLSGLVLLLWQIFYAGPEMEKERLKRQQAVEFNAGKKGQPTASQIGSDNAVPIPAPGVNVGNGTAKTAQPGSAPIPSSSGAPSVPGGLPTAAQSRDVVLAQGPRYTIDTPSLSGSISLKGGRIDDLVLRKYRVKVSKDADQVTFFSPSGSEHPLYAEFGWSVAPGTGIKVPNAQTVWKAQGSWYFVTILAGDTCSRQRGWCHFQAHNFH